MTTVMKFSRPFEGKISLQTVNWQWWLARLPVALLGIPSAYGVGIETYNVLGDTLPGRSIIAFISGGAFEATFIGTVAMASQLYRNDTMIKFLFWGLNLSAVFASIILNVLFFNHGTFTDITLPVLAHAISYPLINFFYNLYLHYGTAEEREAGKHYCSCGRSFDKRINLDRHVRWHNNDDHKPV